jgi:pyruvate/2-oxoglutarate dehydrogenase complex dihydrolipoamide acyltransferase (E2) component
MTEGTLSQWLVVNGDHVEAGMPIYVLETDKVENEVEAVAAGTITLLGEPGETYQVGTVIAEIS